MSTSSDEWSFNIADLLEFISFPIGTLDTSSNTTQLLNSIKFFFNMCSSYIFKVALVIELLVWNVDSQGCFAVIMELMPHYGMLRLLFCQVYSTFQF